MTDPKEAPVNGTEQPEEPKPVRVAARMVQVNAVAAQCPKCRHTTILINPGAVALVSNGQHAQGPCGKCGQPMIVSKSLVTTSTKMPRRVLSH